MGQFSSYVDNLNQQTKTLRNNLTKASGVNCTNYSIAECAHVISQCISEIPDITTGYIRPSWFPDIEKILKDAPTLTVDNKIYYPAYACIVKNTEDTTPFYKNYTNTKTVYLPDHSYCRGTGGNAVVCSDSCDNNPANISINTLQIGDKILHTWDKSKDITRPGYDYGIRWYVVYATSSGTIKDSADNTKIECAIGGHCYGYRSSGSGGDYQCSTLKYLVYTEDFVCTQATSYRNAYLYGLQTLVIKSPYFYDSQSISSSSCTDTFIIDTGSLPVKIATHAKHIYIKGNPSAITYLAANTCKDLFIPNSVKSISNFNNAYKAESIHLPDYLESMSGSPLYTDCLDYIKIPNTLLSWTGTAQGWSTFEERAGTLKNTTYIELFNNFDITGLDLYGHTPKAIRWFKDLCVWLKDRSALTPNTLTIGPSNLNTASNIWLIFNPNDKRDITWVDAGTDGAINIVTYITEQLNWTLS